jgi:Mg2+-importing ATPase
MLKKDAANSTLEQVFATLRTSAQGISDQEAASRSAAYGKNVLQKHSVSAFLVLANQFKNTLVYLLVIASVISYAIKDYSDGTVILVILLVNTMLGFLQEYKSEKIIEKLSLFISRTVRVKRSGQMALLDQSEIVPGDVITLHEGDIAPADMRIIESDDLQVNESQLTGESLPISKRCTSGMLTDDNAMVFTGSIVEKGEVTGVVYAIGSETEFGSIVKLSTETRKETEYEKSLKSFSNLLIKIVVVALAAVFVLKLSLVRGPLHFTALLLFIISMAIAVVPEVLPVIATVSLSSGALKLAKKHVVVKRLSSMEDLGNVLCTDKTGTLTENKMLIQSIVASDNDFFQTIAYATIAVLKGRKHRTSNTYDDAFIAYVSKDIQEQAKAFSIAKELPFDPDDKRRRVVLHNTKNNHYYLIVIGAPEVLLDISQSDKKEQYLKNISDEGKTGLHHIAFAYKQITDYTADYEISLHEDGLSFLGYVSLSDPLRASAKHTIEQAEQLGIQIKILTGDSREVAEYIGRQVGLVDAQSTVYLGSELEAMSPEAFMEAVTTAHVFARVSPTQKYAIIKALKEKYIVGYQGDGINDAPALKLSDVAIAVNSATDIAKENADIILLSKDLEVIINGIKYGRTIFVNINKYIIYTMVNNFGTFAALAVLYLFAKELPLLPIQILLANILTDIPLVTIYSDTVEDSEVVSPEKHNIRQLLFISLVLATPTALFELWYFLIIRFEPLATIQTSVYLYITFIALIIFYALRNKGYFWKAKKPSTLLNISFLAAFIISFVIIYIPIFQEWFHFVGLSLPAALTILGIMIFYFILIDLIKVWYYKSSSSVMARFSFFT